MTPVPLDLSWLPGRYAVCRLPAGALLPAWAASAGDQTLWAVTRTADETSVVCAEDRVPTGVRAERGWAAVGVTGPLDFSLTGVLASIADAMRPTSHCEFVLPTACRQWEVRGRLHNMIIQVGGLATYRGE